MGAATDFTVTELVAQAVLPKPTKSPTIRFFETLPFIVYLNTISPFLIYSLITVYFARIVSASLLVTSLSLNPCQKTGLTSGKFL